MRAVEKVAQWTGSTPSGKTWKIKTEIASHFQIGQRTVTRLMSKRILPYSKVGNVVRFDLDECEHAMQFFKVESIVRGCSVGARPNERLWKTKHQIAAHFQISYRTVTSLMRRRLLPYLKVGQVVRLELGDCDLHMARVGMKSIVAGH